MTLRVSVIGKEWKTHIELMDWVLNGKINGKLNGYTNHFWNGITSLHLAKVISGILEGGNFQPGTFHLVPQDKKSKFELITSIAQISGRRDLKIQEFADSASVDRTLTTQFPELNRNLWGAAGFSGIPTIDLMLEEYFTWDRNQI
jgi:dTDP-4-dehydrorhamnose reductase